MKMNLNGDLIALFFFYLTFNIKFFTLVFFSDKNPLGL